MMDTDKALEVLVRALNNLGEFHMIEKSAFADFISHEDLPKARRKLVSHVEGDVVFTFTDRDNLKKQVEEELAKIGGNFFSFEIAASKEFGICYGTPFRIITELEQKMLRKYFYRENGELREAMEKLDIPHLMDLYSLYTNTGEDGFLADLEEQNDSAMVSEYEAGKRTHYTNVNSGDFVYGKGKKKGKPAFMHIKLKITGSIDQYLGPTFADSLCTKLLSEEETFRENKVLKNPNQWKREEFLSLVFTLPLEDRNPAANREILMGDIDRLPIETIMEETYHNHPELFKEYLILIPQEKQIAVLRKIASSSYKQEELDRQLFDPGYSGRCPEYRWLLMNNPEGFLAFFEPIEDEEKQGIIDVLYRLDDVPEVVMDTLSERYHDLVEEVGVHHVKEVGQ